MDAVSAVVSYPSRSHRANLAWRIARWVVYPIFRVFPLGGFGFPLVVALSQAVDKRLRHQGRSRSCSYELTTVAGIEAERITANRPFGHATAIASHVTILYLHGGGFVFGGLGTHRSVCSDLARATGAEVVSLNYGMLPDGGIGLSVSHAIAAYAALVEGDGSARRQVAVAGDSAGGYLTMKVAELATLRGLPAPTALIGLSPLLSIDPERHHRDRTDDAYLPRQRLADIRPHWLSGPVAIEGAVSPVDAADLIDSPTLLIMAERELLMPDAELLFERLGDRGVLVALHTWKRQIHAFAAMGAGVPESRAAIRVAAQFLAQAVTDAKHRPQALAEERSAG